MSDIGIDYDVCIGKISQCDRFALEELYRELKNPIYRYSLMLLGDESLAEDAMQNTFLRIMSNAGTYRPGSNPKAWIFTIARNVCNDIRRDKLPLSDEGVSEAVADDFTLENVTESIVVRQAIKKLTPEQQEILSLFIFGGLKQTEIAKILGKSYVRVRSQYGYAIKKLRKELVEK